MNSASSILKEKEDTKVEFLYLSEDDMLKAGVTDVRKCIDVLGDVVCLLSDGDYLEGGPTGNAHGIMLEFPKNSPISDFPLNDSRDRRFMAMPAYLGGKFHLVGAKWYGSNARNNARGLPRSNLTLIQNDVETGEPVTKLSANVLSAIRTGSMPGLAAKCLARKDAETFGVIGAGVISKAAVMAVLSVCDKIKTVKIKGSTPQSKTAHTLADFLTKNYPNLTSVKVCATLEETVTGSDIVTEAVTYGKPDEWPRVESAWLKPGALVVSSSVLAFDKDFVAKNVLKVVDNIKMYETYLFDRNLAIRADPENAKKPIGCVGLNFLDMAEKGMFPKSDIHSLGSIVKGEFPGRTSDDQIIFVAFDGMPVLDVAWGCECYKSALKNGIGTKLKVWDRPYLA